MKNNLQNLLTTKATPTLLGMSGDVKFFAMIFTTVCLTICCIFLTTRYFEQKNQQALAEQAQNYLQQLLNRIHKEEEKINLATWNVRDPKHEFLRVSDEILDLHNDYIGVELRDEEGQLIATKLKARMSPAWYTVSREVTPPNIQLNISKAANLRKTVWARSYTPTGERIIEVLLPSKDGKYVWQVFFSENSWLPPKSGLSSNPSFRYTLIDPKIFTPTQFNHHAKLLLFDMEDYLVVENKKETITSVYLDETSLTIAFLGVLLLLLLIKYLLETKKNVASKLTIKNQSAILEQQSKMSNLTEISTTLAHELNQPLASIANYVATSEILLHQSGFSDKKVLGLLQKAREQSLRAGEVIQSIRNLLQSEKQSLLTVDLNQLIEKLRPVLDITANDHDCKLHIHCPPQTKVQAIPLLLELVILNLVKNAAEAMLDTQPKFKNIDLKIRVVKQLTETKNDANKFNDHVRIDVIDAGMGIKGENASNLFNSFFTTKAHGMGLGLKLCRTVAESFGGHLRWENNPEQGATFTLVLPLPKEKIKKTKYE